MLQKQLTAMLLVLSTATVNSLHAQPKAASWTPEQVTAILKTRIDIEKKGVGIVVGLIGTEKTQVIEYGSTGRKGASSKLDGNTVFEIGSATKVFTSLLLADMVVRGEVALNDPVSKFLPKTVSMPTRGEREINLQDLSTHTSALPRLPSNLASADNQNPYASYSVEQMYSFLSSYKLTRDIGAKYEYSNLGAGLLGHVLSLRAGMDFESLVVSRIGKPLGMTSTSIQLTEDMQRRLSPGHDATLNEVKNWDFLTLAGAGAIRSTVNDMTRFVEANMGRSETTLSKAMLTQQSSRTSAGSPNLSIALGWHILANFGSEVVWHNGQTGGYHSFIGFDKKRGVGVVVLANCSTDIDDIALHLIDTRYPITKSKKERTEVQVDTKILDRYVGNYALAPTFVISVTKEGDRLMLQATGQPKFEIFAESESKFFLKAVDAQISFVKDNRGSVTELILHQNGANQRGKRVAK